MARRTEGKAKHRARGEAREGVTGSEEAMAARSIATLTVSFGMVSIPVKLFSATEASRALSFNLLHKGCGSRLRQQYFCVKEDVPVSRDEMVKGYEFSKDQYVTFEPQELKAMEEAGTHTADITEFVPITAVDPVYFDKAYYLAPDKGGAKPYALLTKALRESNRCALGRWAARGKQYIVMIRPVEDGLVMQQLLYAAEVRSIKDIEIPKTEVKPAELKLAQQLIEQQATDTFDPAAYKDDVRERIEAAVQKKVEGQEVTMPEAPEPTAQVIDLMEALRASLDKKQKAEPQRKPAEAKKPAEARKPPKRAQHAEPAARKAARK
jgi:DNA end-binding protein Ku